MTRTKAMKRTTVSSVIAIVVCLAMLLGATWAWFTDTVINSGNTITSGRFDFSVKLQVLNAEDAWEDASDPIFNNVLLAPGQSVVRVLNVVNNGSIDMRWDAAIVETEDVGNLTDVIDVYYKWDVTANTNDISGWSKIGTLTEYMNGEAENVLKGNLAAGGNKTFAIALKLQEGANNNYQNLTAIFDIKIIATELLAGSEAIVPDAENKLPQEVTITVAPSSSQAPITAAKVEIPAGVKLEEGATELKLNVAEVEVPADVVVPDGQTAIALEISLDGLADDNGTAVEVTLTIDKNLAGVVLYHYDEQIACTYDPATGILTFATDNFSPFTIVHDEVEVEETQPEPEETQPEPEETQPEETQPEETQPEETQPEETQPEPEETQPAPEETQPEETQPEETQPEETQPEETQPEETQPEETEPEETEPETEPTYTVIFKDWNGEELKSETVEEGASATAPTAPTREGYTFVGWDEAFDNVTADIIVTAQYEINKYKVTWIVDGNETEVEVEYGTVPVFEGSTDKAADAQYTYTFDGWDTEVVAVTGDVTYTAVYASTLNEYLITFVNEDGTELQSGKLAYGETPVYAGEAPTKEANAQYSFAFAGWTPAIAEVTADATYTATYTEITNEYCVIFQDEDGTELQIGNVAYGQTPVYEGETPTKAATPQYTYTFAGWDPEINVVTRSVTYTATYTATVNKYTVTWIVDGNETEVEVEYDTVPAFEGSTDKADDAYYTYTFTGWDAEVVAVTGDVTYTATYATTTKAHADAITANGDSYTTPVVEGNTVTFKAQGAIRWAKSAWGVYDNWIGFRITTPEGVDAANVVITRPDSVNKTLASVLDSGKNYASMYLGVADEAAAGETVFTYTIDWNGDEIADLSIVLDISEATLTPEPTYTVTWKNEDGSVLETDTGLKLNAMPEYNGETPVKAADAQYTYTFAGWNVEVAPVTGDVEYVATYTSTVNKYTVTWIIDGEEETEEYEFGATPEYKGETPAKEADEQYTYTFAGWGDIVAVNGDAIYTAQFSTTTNKYTVTWIIDGEEETEEYEYGAMPTHADPEKAADNYKVYTFAGWTPAIEAVTADATYEATFDETARTYTIVFLDWNGTELQKTTAAYYGDFVTAPANPSREADEEWTYTFEGWDPAVSITVAGDATYTAVYSKTANAYTITWIVDGNETTEQYAYGATPEFKGSTDKAADALYTYEFISWTPAISAVTGDAIYTATYDRIDRVHDNYVVNLRGLGAAATISGWRNNAENPAGQYTLLNNYNNNEIANKGGAYVFFESNVMTISGVDLYKYSAMTIRAAAGNDFGATLTIKVNGEAIKTYCVAYNSSNKDFFDYGPGNYSENLKLWDYTFALDRDLMDATVTIEAAANQAIFVTDVSFTGDLVKNTPAEHTVTFVDKDGGYISSQVVLTGSAATAPSAPSVTGHTFAGWDKEFANVTEDITVQATYNINYYTVTFQNWDGSEISSESMAYGAEIVVPADPTKAADAQYTYTFAGWDVTPAATVTGDVTYTATYDATLNKYTVTFLGKDGEALDEQEVEYGSAATAPEIPEIEGWSFVSWNKSFDNVTGDLEVQAIYAEDSAPTYTVTWKNYNGDILKVEVLEEGTTPVYTGETPLRPADAQYTYTHNGWDPEPSELTNDITYTATFSTTVNKYLVTFKNWDGTVLYSEYQEYGSAITAPSASRDTTASTIYNHTGWTPSVAATVTDNVEYTAVFGETTRTYKVVYQSHAGAWLYQVDVAYGSDAPNYSQAEIANLWEGVDKLARNGMTFTGWGSNRQNITGETTVVAQYVNNSMTLTAQRNVRTIANWGPWGISTGNNSITETVLAHCRKSSNYVPYTINAWQTNSAKRIEMSGWMASNGGQQELVWSVTTNPAAGTSGTWYSCTDGSYSTGEPAIETAAKGSAAELTSVNLANARFANVMVDLSAYAGQTINVCVGVRNGSTVIVLLCFTNLQVVG